MHNDRKPEITTETGNIYIGLSGTMTDNIESSTANLAFYDHRELNKVSKTDCNSDRQPKQQHGR